MLTNYYNLFETSKTHCGQGQMYCAHVFQPSFEPLLLTRNQIRYPGAI
jgi:hypothetical protein